MSQKVVKNIFGSISQKTQTFHERLHCIRWLRHVYEYIKLDSLAFLRTVGSFQKTSIMKFYQEALFQWLPLPFSILESFQKTDMLFHALKLLQSGSLFLDFTPLGWQDIRNMCFVGVGLQKLFSNSKTKHLFSYFKRDYECFVLAIDLLQIYLYFRMV